MSKYPCERVVCDGFTACLIEGTTVGAAEACEMSGRCCTATSTEEYRSKFEAIVFDAFFSAFHTG